jgi:hypothetical protein
MEVTLRVLAVRQLPPGSVRGPLRIQATLGDVRKESGDSVWGKGSSTQVSSRAAERCCGSPACVPNNPC